MGARVVATVHDWGGNVPPPTPVVPPPLGFVPLPPLPLGCVIGALPPSSWPVQAANAATDSVSASAERGLLKACMTTLN